MMRGPRLSRHCLTNKLASSLRLPVGCLLLVIFILVPLVMLNKYNFHQFMNAAAAAGSATLTGASMASGMMQEQELGQEQWSTDKVHSLPAEEGNTMQKLPKRLHPTFISGESTSEPSSVAKPVHPFFLNFECEDCQAADAATVGAASSLKGIRWTIPRARDFDMPEYKEIVQGKLSLPFRRIRKDWEFYIIYGTLLKMGVLGPGKSGLGIGVGEEPLPSAFAALGAKVLGTDMFPDGAATAGWTAGKQYASSKDALFKPNLIERGQFEQLVNFTYADMNRLPPEYQEQYDFVWSSCTMEHAGSLAASKAFFINSVNLLKPGGVTIHTTEFLLSDLEDTLDSPHTSIWRYKDVREVYSAVGSLGFMVFPIDVAVPVTESQLDQYVDLPPYHQETLDNHLKMVINDKYSSTSMVLVAHRPLAGTMKKGFGPHLVGEAVPIQAAASKPKSSLLHPFFLNFKCGDCQAADAAAEGATSSWKGIRWTIPKAKDFETPDYKRISQGKLLIPAGKAHRKYWEFFIVYDTLLKMNVVGPGKSGLGIGVGQEPLPSAFAALGAKILGTDMFPDGAATAGWSAGKQYAKSNEALFQSKLIKLTKFEELVNFTYMDMNKIPLELFGQFDFVWSSCTIEHAGSLAQSKNFVINSVNLLKPGGVSIHTTELLLSDLENTLDSQHTAIWRYKDILEVHNALKTLGMTVFPIDVEIPAGQQLDQYVDLPPYQKDNHLKLIISEKYASTSVVLVVHRPFN